MRRPSHFNDFNHFNYFNYFNFLNSNSKPDGLACPREVAQGVEEVEIVEVVEVSLACHGACESRPPRIG
jgi:hypothetical protein